MDGVTIKHDEELEWVETDQDYRIALMAGPENGFRTWGTEITIADILRAEGFKIASLADLHMIIIPTPAATRLFATASLRFLDILPGCLTLLLSSHTTSFKLANWTNT